jgi:transposase
MVATTDSFETWLQQAHIPAARLTPQQHTLLQASFRFCLSQGSDYYSNRLLGHFLLHCGSGLKVAAIARLLGISRPTASRQQALSSKQAIQQAHHRMDGRPSGKLLPRYAGPIAHFLLSHADATRADLLDFIDNTFEVRVSRIALYKFLKKYGLDRIADTTPTTPQPQPQPAGTRCRPTETVAARPSTPPFCSDARGTRVPS